MEYHLNNTIINIKDLVKAAYKDAFESAMLECLKTDGKELNELTFTYKRTLLCDKAYESFYRKHLV